MAPTEETTGTSVKGDGYTLALPASVHILGNRGEQCSRLSPPMLCKHPRMLSRERTARFARAGSTPHIWNIAKNSHVRRSSRQETASARSEEHTSELQSLRHL